MHIIIFGNQYRAQKHQEMQLLFDRLQQFNIEISIDEDFYLHLINDIGVDPHTKNIFRDNDFIAYFAISLGGDGTLLGTAARIGNKYIPIVGINMGRLGFLADVYDDEITQVLQDLQNNNFRIEERTALVTHTNDGSGYGHPVALNEVAILKQDLSSMIRIHTSIQGEFLHTYEADGLIISTPTGSTAYALSVGGPIIVPESRNLLIAPVATHSLNVRPLIIPDDWQVDLQVESRSQSYLLSLDGRSQQMPISTSVSICKSDYTVKIVRFSQHSFFSTLKQIGRASCRERVYVLV